MTEVRIEDIDDDNVTIAHHRADSYNSVARVTANSRDKTVEVFITAEQARQVIDVLEPVAAHKKISISDLFTSNVNLKFKVGDRVVLNKDFRTLDRHKGDLGTVSEARVIASPTDGGPIQQFNVDWDNDDNSCGFFHESHLGPAPVKPVYKVGDLIKTRYLSPLNDWWRVHSITSLGSLWVVLVSSPERVGLVNPVTVTEHYTVEEQEANGKLVHFDLQSYCETQAALLDTPIHLGERFKAIENSSYAILSDFVVEALGEFKPAPATKFKIGDRVVLNQDFEALDGYKGDLGTVTFVRKAYSWGGNPCDIKWDKEVKHPDLLGVVHDSHLDPAPIVTVKIEANTLAWRAATTASKFKLDTIVHHTDTDHNLAELADIVAEIAMKVEK